MPYTAREMREYKIDRAKYGPCATCRLYFLHRWGNLRKHSKACRKQARAAREQSRARGTDTP